MPTGARAVGLAGIVAGLLALWLAPPPFEVRAQGAPVALALVGVGCGAYALQAREWRIGGWAVAVAIVARAARDLGAGPQHARRSATSSTPASSPRRCSTRRRSSSPASAASTRERSGVVNIGLEGMMLTGAFFGIWACDKAGRGRSACSCACSRRAAGPVHAFFSIHLRADQIVIRHGDQHPRARHHRLRVPSTSTATTACRRSCPRPRQSASPGIRSIPGIAGVFGALNLMIWLLFALIIAIHIVLFKTPIGPAHPRRRRAPAGGRHGRHPGVRRALRRGDRVGHAGRARRRLPLVRLRRLVRRGHDGRPRVHRARGDDLRQVAAVRCVRRRLLFGFAMALGDRLQTSANVSADLLSMLPYVFTLIALVGLVGRSVPPAADGRPYVKE